MAGISITQTRAYIEPKGFDVVLTTDSPKSRLMYYISCVSSTLNMGREAMIRRLRDYTNVDILSEDETDQLLIYCFLLSPDVLLDKCIFYNDAMCGEYDNEFFEVSTVQTKFQFASEVVIGSTRRKVSKIMFCKNCWIMENYHKPLEYYKERFTQLQHKLLAQQLQLPQPGSGDKTCAIL